MGKPKRKLITPSPANATFKKPKNINNVLSPKSDKNYSSMLTSRNEITIIDTRFNSDSSVDLTSPDPNPEQHIKSDKTVSPKLNYVNTNKT